MNRKKRTPRKDAQRTDPAPSRRSPRRQEKRVDEAPPGVSPRSVPADRRDRVDQVLRGFAPDLKPGGRDRWTLNPRADAASHVTVRRRGSWLHFEMPDVDRRGRSPWDLLHAAGAGPGPGKAVLGPDGRTVHVRADVPASLNGTLSDRCREGMASVRLIDAMLRGQVRKDAVAPAAPRTTTPSPRTTDPASRTTTPALHTTEPASRTTEPAPRPPAELCAETGWSARELEDGTVTVDLETSRGVHRAEIRTGPDGITRMSVTLARFKTLSKASREALGRFLLTAGRVTRLVRPVVREDGKKLAVAFEFETCMPLAAADVDEALVALATAAQEFGREAQGLGDDALARRYLKSRDGGGPDEE